MANEKRLIEANDLWQKTFVCDEVAEVRKFIENAPTVDAAEVVRCKDCEFCYYNSSNDTYKCGSMNGMYRTVKTDDFCSYGERRES